MPYIPKSQLNFKFTNQGLIEKISKAPYKGAYMETSDGKLYVGHDNFLPGPELIIKPKALEKRVLDRVLDKNEKYFSFTKDVRTFNNKNNPIKKFLEFKTKLPSSKPIPITNDYRIGSFKRYFAKRINGNAYIEISKKDYNNIKEKRGKYDHNLYEIGSIIWRIRGNNAYQQNAQEIKKAQRIHKNLLYLFPVLNEYLLESGEVQENLETKGGELFFENGDEYIGNFHIHPEQGPMVGAQHTDTPHDKLYFFQSLPVIEGQSYQSFLQNYNKINCFKCIQITSFSDPEVISNERSSLVGCPEGSFTTYNEALANCPQVIDPLNPSVEGFYSTFNTSSNTITEYVTNLLNNSNNGGSTGGGSTGGGSTGGTGTSGGGGGGY